MISYKHATIQQAQEAVLDLWPRLMPGGNKDFNAEVLAADCLMSYGLGTAFPADGLRAMISQNICPPHPKARENLANALRPLAEKLQAVKANQPEGEEHLAEAVDLGLDWKALAKLALQFLLSLMG